MQQTINLINDNLSSIIAVLVAAGIVSTVTQGFKKWLSLENPKVIMFLTVTLSFLATVIPFIISAAGKDPTLLGSHTLEVIGAATFIYRYAVKPLSDFLVNYKDFRKSTATTNVVDPVAIPVAASVAPVQLTPIEQVAPLNTNEFIG